MCSQTRRMGVDGTLPLQTMHVKNFTLFEDVKLSFSRGLNVIIGENSSGKTHLLKIAYCVVFAISEKPRRPSLTGPTKALLQVSIADKLTNVFRPEALGRLTRRQPGRQRSDVHLTFTKPDMTTAFSFATNSKSEVAVNRVPARWLTSPAAFIPTRELLTMYPGFVSMYETTQLEAEETWRDTCVLLGLPLQRGPRVQRISKLLEPLEQAMDGQIEADKNGRFYLRTKTGRMEMPLVAEGLRKLGMIARLIATGALLDNGYLFWDEPEAGLNPRLIKRVAKTICDLATSGIQVFIATHSLFLLRELEILLSEASVDAPKSRFFSLHASSDRGVEIEQGDSIADVGSIAALDEDLEQSDRFLGL